MPLPGYPSRFIGAEEGVWGVPATARFAANMATGARIFHVQPNHPLAVDLGNTGEDPGCPFVTVTAALARCENNRGDVILVGGNDAWQYGGGGTWNLPVAESVVCNKQGVAIIGVTPDPLGVVWQPAAANGTCLTIHALGVEVAGFLFQGAGGAGDVGVLAEWDGATTWGDSPNIHHCFFDDTLAQGIALEYSWNAHIHKCEFYDCDYGIYCDPLGSGFDLALIEDCRFRGCSISAISATGGCDENMVRHCSVYNANAAAGAAATDEGYDFTGGNENLVEDCSFTCLLPVPAAGDYNDLNTAAATDAWVNNHCMDGLAVTNPT